MQITREIQKRANIVARQAGHGIADEIIFDKTAKADHVKSHIAYGYRKFTTGEYVPHAYRKNFGWKNTYYQAAETIVVLAVQ